MEQISSALTSEGHLDQSLLSSLARNPLKQYLQQDLEDVSAADVHMLWSKLTGSLMTKNMPEKYLTAACNSVSVFLLAGSTSPTVAIRDFVFSRPTWMEGYRCVEHAFSCGKTKAALQVLETLGHLLKEHSDKQLASDLLDESLRSMVGTVIIDQPQGYMKASCISISCFIRKTPTLSMFEETVSSCLRNHSLTWQHRRALNHMPDARSPEKLSALQELFLALLFAINDIGTRSAALKLFSQLCSDPNLAQGCAVAQAAQVLECYIEQNLATLSDVVDNVLPVILDDRAQFDSFFKMYSTNVTQSESRLILYLGVLKAGRLKSFISEDDLPLMVQPSLSGSQSIPRDDENPYQALSVLLRAGNPSVRLYTYDVLTASFATKASVPTGVLDCLLACFRSMHDDNNAYERGELLGITRRFFKRLNNSYLSLNKLHSVGRLDDMEIARISAYEDFTDKLALFLSSELEIGLAYQRHILALHTLQLLLKTSFVHWTKDDTLRARVATLVLDAYDDVRALSAFILSSLCENSNGIGKLTGTNLSESVSELAAETCRHDHADAAAHMLAVQANVRRSSNQASDTSTTDGDSNPLSTVILTKLATHIGTASKLCPESGFPLHAYLLALTHIHTTEAIRAYHTTRILHVCSRIWELVQPQLCIDSPETGTEEVEMEGSTGPKDLLAYSWRALRDSSLLLQTVIKWDQTSLAQIGSLCMKQLTQLRHRGAFSTVAQTFTLCCEAVRMSTDAQTQSLIDKWYEAAFAEIDVQARQLTRRSAGIPAMFNAIISPTKNNAFSLAISSMKAKAVLPVSEEEMRQAQQSLPQVHALNCIKDIVINSRFRSISEPYISELIDLSADRLSSDLWAIRNCGLMLLRACMMRLDPKMVDSSPSSLEFASSKTAHKSPIQVALRLLEGLESDVLTTEYASRGSEKIFAALDLVRHVGQAGQYDQLLRRLVREHLKSPIWAIRDHAARVLAAKVALADDWTTLVEECRASLLSSENEVHGRLLFLRYCFEIHGEQLATSAWDVVVRPISSVIIQIEERRKARAVSPFTEAAVFDLINSILKMALLQGEVSDEVQQLALSAHSWPQNLNQVNPYLQQRLLLCRIYCYLLKAGDATQPAQADLDLSGDTDVERYAAEGLQQLADALTPGIQKPGLGNVLQYLIKHSTSAYTLGCLMTAMASCLEQEKGFVSRETAQVLLRRCTELSEPPDRELCNGRTRLQAALIKTWGLDSSIGINVTLMRALTADLVAAARDVLELPTRLTAAYAISSCIQEVLSHRHELDLRDGPRIPLQLLLILYDQLNDDNEEIRQTAQETAHKVMSALSEGRGSIRLCSVSSRQHLLELILALYGTDAALPQISVARMAGLNDGSMDLDSILADTVEERLSNILKDINDLFAEERQNLYIDELTEIKAWSNVFRKCGSKGLQVGTWLQAAAWCQAGIGALRSLNSASPEDGKLRTNAFDTTHNNDVLELCMRVICMSQALVAVNVKPEDEAEKREAAVLRERLADQLSAWQTKLCNDGAHPLLAATISHHE